MAADPFCQYGYRRSAHDIDAAEGGGKELVLCPHRDGFVNGLGVRVFIDGNGGEFKKSLSFNAT